MGNELGMTKIFAKSRDRGEATGSQKIPFSTEILAGLCLSPQYCRSHGSLLFPWPGLMQNGLGGPVPVSTISAVQCLMVAPSRGIYLHFKIVLTIFYFIETIIKKYVSSNLDNFQCCRLLSAHDLDRVFYFFSLLSLIF